MPPDAVKVDRTTRWGNPFVVGRDGSQVECVEAFNRMLAGDLKSTGGVSLAQQRACIDFVASNISLLRGKSLACWCREDSPCHADVLLRRANSEPSE